MRSELTSVLSRWTVQGERFHGLKLENMKKQHTEKHRASCNVELSANENKPSDEYTEIT